MKSTGIVRNIDSLGRIVLPIELRRTLNIDASKGDPIEIYMDGTSIVLRKHEPNCALKRFQSSRAKTSAKSAAKSWRRTSNPRETCEKEKGRDRQNLSGPFLPVFYFFVSFSSCSCRCKSRAIFSASTRLALAWAARFSAS